MAATLRDIGRYFIEGHESATLTLHPGGPLPETTAAGGDVFDRDPDYEPGVSEQSPIQYFCQQNFVILLSDGRPQSDRVMNAHLADYDGDCISATPACLPVARYEAEPNLQFRR